MQTERRVAANHQTKPTSLGCEFAERMAATTAYHPQTPSPFIIITQLISWYT